jgi:hypothetical protein
MSVRAYISIQLLNGQRLRYVRDVSDGENELYYKYGDTAGDSWGAQGDSTQIKYAYDALTTSFEGDSSWNRFLLFPESDGDTYFLVRDNYDVPKGDRGDSEFWNPKVRTKISANSVQSISVIEERLDAWYSDDV